MSIGPENSIFTTLDLVSGYWQVPLTKKSKQYTAFSNPNGHYAFEKMPFCISGAPFTFQRLINSVFSGIIGDSVFVFLDDLIIASKDFETYLQNLEEVLSRLKSVGLSLKLSKLKFHETTDCCPRTRPRRGGKSYNPRKSDCSAEFPSFERSEVPKFIFGP